MDGVTVSVIEWMYVVAVSGLHSECDEVELQRDILKY